MSKTIGKLLLVLLIAMIFFHQPIITASRAMPWWVTLLAAWFFASFAVGVSLGQFLNTDTPEVRKISDDEQ